MSIKTEIVTVALYSAEGKDISAVDVIREALKVSRATMPDGVICWECHAMAPLQEPSVSEKTTVLTVALYHDRGFDAEGFMANALNNEFDSQLERDMPTVNSWDIQEEPILLSVWAPRLGPW